MGGEGLNLCVVSPHKWKAKFESDCLLVRGNIPTRVSQDRRDLPESGGATAVNPAKKTPNKATQTRFSSS